MTRTAELVEMEVRELLTNTISPATTRPSIIGSALKALQGDQSEMGEPSIFRLAKRWTPTSPSLSARWTAPS